MTRLLLSGLAACPFACTYCFAKFGEPLELKSLENSNPQLLDSDIIYPCCDSEFARTTDFIESLRRISSQRPYTIFSLSTKGLLRDSFLEQVAQFDAEIRMGKRGLIKLGVSFSTKCRTAEIEPKASSYVDRLKTAKRIKSYGIASSINLKPILPFIPFAEYRSIVDDTLDLEAPYLIGGLYLSKSSEFFLKYIDKKFTTSERAVEWLPNMPSWTYIDSEKVINGIKDYVITRNGTIFDSDPQLLLSHAKLDNLQTK